MCRLASFRIWLFGILDKISNPMALEGILLVYLYILSALFAAFLLVRGEKVLEAPFVVSLLCLLFVFVLPRLDLLIIKTPVGEVTMSYNR